MERIAARATTEQRAAPTVVPDGVAARGAMLRGVSEIGGSEGVLACESHHRCAVLVHPSRKADGVRVGEFKAGGPAPALGDRATDNSADKTISW